MGATDAFPLEPDYTIPEQFDDGMLRTLSHGGKIFSRLVRPPRRMFRLSLRNRPTSEKETLLQFYREMEATWFTLDHATYLVETGAYLPRVFPVHFAGPPAFEFVSHDNHNMEVELVEAAGYALETADYPDPDDGHPTATITGIVSGSDKIFLYGGYGFVYTGAGTLALDGGAVSSPKLDVPLGLHRLYVTGGAGTLEVVI